MVAVFRAQCFDACKMGIGSLDGLAAEQLSSSSRGDCLQLWI